LIGSFLADNESWPENLRRNVEIEPSIGVDSIDPVKLLGGKGAQRREWLSVEK
jgi:hypothetical protein